MRRDYNKLLQAGNAAQLEKLKQNEHKKGFDDIDFCYAINRIRQEFIELENAWREYNYYGSLKMLEPLRSEAADVANFAHMIILAVDNAIKESRS